ncbi:BspA family leucine-rich repeat surface protein [Mycoplasma feriruminatoris]|uniref:BspA family leucine-rich repeat surface protein n=1 Tax=Mycoplasma feriruminatoris TaxID=1179777 RepID=A0AAQ3DPN4_9MOLU|nr:BspA family leucine-rich repeat surface protein [Mycoplasma feriruminatoris]WFQ94807.1 BspA family leucine-rich repeat surface protein [Mycoplasma feriruminatoris]
MKKLLSVLSSALLAISTSIFLIACKSKDTSDQQVNKTNDTHKEIDHKDESKNNSDKDRDKNSKDNPTRSNKNSNGNDFGKDKPPKDQSDQKLNDDVVEAIPEENETDHELRDITLKDNSGKEIKGREITKLGFYKTKDGKFGLQQVQPDVIKVPSKLPSYFTILKGAFYRSESSYIQGIESWDTSRITDMNALFEDAENFNQDISKWDVSSVQDIEDMFKGAKSFNQNLSSWTFKDSVKHKDFAKSSGIVNNKEKWPKNLKKTIINV